MRQLLLLLIIAGVGAGISACSHDPSPAPCPSDATHGVLWSSEYSPSRLQLFKETDLLWEQSIPVKGLQPGRGMERFGDRFVGVATGDGRHTETHIVTFDASTCALQATQIPTRHVYGWTASADAVYTMDTVNNVAQLSRFTLDGSPGAKVRYEGEGTSGLAVGNESLVLVTDLARDWASSSGLPKQFITRKLDRASLEVEGRTEVPLGLPGWQNPVIVGERVLFAVGVDQREDHEIGEFYAMDLETVELEHRKLEATAPYWFTHDPEADDNQILLAHTAVNPSFRPMSEYRNVSIVDATTLEATTVTLDRGISQLAANKGIMFAHGEHGERQDHVDAYRISDATPVFKQDLEAPKKMDTAYVSAVLALG